MSAQTITDNLTPGAIQERSRDSFEYHTFQKRLETEKPSSKDDILEKEEVDIPVLDSDQTFFVSSIQTTESHILTEKEIRTVTKNYEEQDLSLNDLARVTDELNALYAEKDFLTAHAVLLPQKIQDGIVHITLIEGRIGRILLQDNPTTKSIYIQKQLALSEGEILRVDRLEDAIIHFNGTHEVKVSALLQPGEEFGTSDVLLQAAEPEPWDIILFEDNAGREETGLYRTGLNVVHKSVLGYRDRFTLSGIWAKGAIDAYISYNIPINSKGTRFGVSYNYSETSVISGPLESLDIDGKATTVSLFATHPLLIQERLWMNAHAGYHIKESKTDFSDVPLFDSDVRSFTFGFDHTHLGDKYSLALRHNFNQGFAEAGGDISYFAYDGDYSFYRVVTEKSYALLRSRFQVSDTKILPSQEQFQIGGISSVRGYEEGFLIGENGYFLSGEFNFSLQCPKYTSGLLSHLEKFRGFVFLDHGETFTRAQLSTDTDDLLTSTGFGVTFDDVSNFSARLMMGVPLRHYDDNDDPRFHFHIQYKF